MLLQTGGAEAVTTRSVARRAGVQPPAIYRAFGDKDGLLDAVAEHVFAAFVAAKTESLRQASEEQHDPIEDLRAGWRTYIDFGLSQPAVYALMSDPARAQRSPASGFGQQILAARVHRLALAGGLVVAESTAVDLIHAAGTGVLLTLLATPIERRDLGLSAVMFETVLARITGPSHHRGHGGAEQGPDRLVTTGGTPEKGAVAPAVALRAAASSLEPLTDAERRLLAEWLDRVIDTEARRRPVRTPPAR